MQPLDYPPQRQKVRVNASENGISVGTALLNGVWDGRRTATCCPDYGRISAHVLRVQAEPQVVMRHFCIPAFGRQIKRFAGRCGRSDATTRMWPSPRYGNIHDQCPLDQTVLRFERWSASPFDHLGDILRRCKKYGGAPNIPAGIFAGTPFAGPSLLELS